MNSSSTGMTIKGRELRSSGYGRSLTFSMLGEVLSLHLERFGQIGDSVVAQVIHDTRPEGDPAIVHGARHLVRTFREAAGALLVRRQAVQRFYDVQQPNFARLHAEGEPTRGTFAG